MITMMQSTRTTNATAPAITGIMGNGWDSEWADGTEGEGIATTETVVGLAKTTGPAILPFAVGL
jgi:hypothetical protein